MKKVYNCFYCDECGKESPLLKEEHKFHTGYPYDAKWIYLYSLSFKEKKDNQKSFNDKHFCSRDCMRKFVMKKLMEDEVNERMDKLKWD